MLEIKNVSKGYGRQKVIEDMSFVVHDGCIHGLIGENSAGKTTLIKTIVGIYKADSGEVLYDGEAIYDHPKVKENVAYVADTNEYIPGYTVKRMVRFYKDIFERFDESAFYALNEVFGLELKKSISALSKGQKMRLAFMLNMARHPKYLIMDEPTSGIDPIAKKKLFEALVQEVEATGMTVLISSHHLEELESICDEITMIKNGKIRIDASVEEAKENFAKLQIVFKNGLPKGFAKWPQVQHFSNVGSIYTVIVSDYNEDLHNKILQAGADFVEALDVNLEELFLFANEEVENDERKQ